MTQMDQMGGRAAIPDGEAAAFQHPIRAICVICGPNIRGIRG